MIRTRGEFIFALVVIVVMGACLCGIYQWTDSDCKDRGGHTEFVYGGRGGWFCEGSDR